MNFIKENRASLQVFFVFVISIAVIVLVFAAIFRGPSGETDVGGTSTAIEQTAQALLGPFPTSTAPTSTASYTPVPTFTPSRTPTRTPTATSTPRVIVTFTANGTLLPKATLTGTRLPTRTSRPALTQTPRPRPTNTRRPTSYP